MRTSVYIDIEWEGQNGASIVNGKAAEVLELLEMYKRGGLCSVKKYVWKTSRMQTLNVSIDCSNLDEVVKGLYRIEGIKQISIKYPNPYRGQERNKKEEDDTQMTV